MTATNAFSGGTAPIEFCLFLFLPRKDNHSNNTCIFISDFSTVPLLGTYTPLHWHKTWTMFTTLTNDPGYQRNSLSDISIYFEKYGITINDLFPSTLWPCLVGILTHFYAIILVYEDQAWVFTYLLCTEFCASLRFSVRPSIAPRSTYREFRKKCVFFSQFTATPPTSLQETFKALNKMRVYSHSYWLVIFCTTNSSRVLARESWQTFENSWKITQYLMNTLYKIKYHTRSSIKIVVLLICSTATIQPLVFIRTVRRL